MIVININGLYINRYKYDRLIIVFFIFLSVNHEPSPTVLPLTPVKSKITAITHIIKIIKYILFCFKKLLKIFSCFLTTFINLNNKTTIEYEDKIIFNWILENIEKYITNKNKPFFKYEKLLNSNEKLSYFIINNITHALINPGIK